MGGRNRCLYLVDTLGNREDFSNHFCIDGLNIDKIIIQTFRETIEPQIHEFKKERFRDNNFEPIVCPLTGILLEYRSPDCHVDHDFSSPDTTFKGLYQHFLEEQKIQLSDLKDAVICVGPHKTFKSPTLENWQQFHRKHAKLRLIHASANIRGNI